jgi:hypothetical protein
MYRRRATVLPMLRATVLPMLVRVVPAPGVLSQVLIEWSVKRKNAILDKRLQTGSDLLLGPNSDSRVVGRRAWMVHNGTRRGVLDPHFAL